MPAYWIADAPDPRKIPRQHAGGVWDPNLEFHCVGRFCRPVEADDVDLAADFPCLHCACHCTCLDCDKRDSGGKVLWPLGIKTGSGVNVVWAARGGGPGTPEIDVYFLEPLDKRAN